MDDVAPQILAIVARSKSLPLDSVSPASSFDDLQIDSLDKINLAFEIEELFQIQIPDNAINSLRTIADVIAGVEKLQAEKQAPTPTP